MQMNQVKASALHTRSWHHCIIQAVQDTAHLFQVLQWEKLHQNRCGGPRLKKFAGRPQDYSPKARLLNFLGYKLPFDRHDWVVDRCGKEVR